MKYNGKLIFKYFLVSLCIQAKCYYILPTNKFGYVSQIRSLASTDTVAETVKNNTVIINGMISEEPTKGACELATEGVVTCSSIRTPPPSVWTTFGDLSYKTGAVNLGQVILYNIKNKFSKILLYYFPGLSRLGSSHFRY